MPPARNDPPQFWIIAGPNGSGKSTLYGSTKDAVFGNALIFDDAQPFRIINPDLLAGRIRDIERLGRDAANLEAVKRIEAWLEASIAVHESVGVETVLSTDKYRRLVDRAKTRGFEIRLVYVVLQNPDLNVSRVRLRVKKGGHGVPEKKIRARWERSLIQLPWFLHAADWALLLDNSEDLRVVGRKEKGVVTLDPSAPEALWRAIDKQADGFQ